MSKIVDSEKEPGQQMGEVQLAEVHIGHRPRNVKMGGGALQS